MQCHKKMQRATRKVDLSHYLKKKDKDFVKTTRKMKFYRTDVFISRFSKVPVSLKTVASWTHQQRQAALKDRLISVVARCDVVLAASNHAINRQSSIYLL